VLKQDAAEVHAVQLIAAEDQTVVEAVVEDVDEVLADGIGGALVPARIREGLFRGQNFNETTRELVKLVALIDMAVKRCRVELGEDVDPAEVGIDAIADRDIHQAIFAGQRHGRFGTFLGEREEAGALSAAHNDAKNIRGVGGYPFEKRCHIQEEVSSCERFGAFYTVRHRPGASRFADR